VDILPQHRMIAFWALGWFLFSLSCSVFPVRSFLFDLSCSVCLVWSLHTRSSVVFKATIRRREAIESKSEPNGEGRKRFRAGVSSCELDIPVTLLSNIRSTFSVHTNWNLICSSTSQYAPKGILPYSYHAFPACNAMPCPSYFAFSCYMPFCSSSFS